MYMREREPFADARCSLSLLNELYLVLQTLRVPLISDLAS